MSDNLWFERWELHRWFDKLWGNHQEREMLYDKLAQQLNIPIEQCHFSTMSKEQLEKALTIIKKWWFEKYDH